MEKEKLDRKIDEYSERNHIGGMIRVTVQGKTEYEKSVGFADYENKTEFSDKSMFTYYSLSKPFCAIGLMKLVDKGLVSLESHPSLYLPQAEKLHPSLTVRDTLYHTCGIPDIELHKYLIDENPTADFKNPRRCVEIAASYPPLFKPGTDYLYANINYNIAALITENVSGMAYGDYLKKEVFAPLSMNCARVDSENLHLPERVKGYELRNGKLCEVKKVFTGMLGAGDIIGTVNDVYGLNLALKNRLLLTEKSWEQILTPNKFSGMGMGCAVSVWHSKQRITNNGGHTGFRTMHLYIPEDDFDIIILSNSGFGTPREDISELIYDEFYGDNGGFSQKVNMDVGYI